MKRRSVRAWRWASAWLLCAVAGGAAAQAVDDAASVARGKRLFMRCAACHEASAGGVAKIGPHLQGLVGRESGSVAGFVYSPAMKAKPFAWDRKQLDAWLLNPSAVVPGTTMALAGMTDEAERRALIAYLASLK